MYVPQSLLHTAEEETVAMIQLLKTWLDQGFLVPADNDYYYTQMQSKGGIVEVNGQKRLPIKTFFSD